MLVSPLVALEGVPPCLKDAANFEVFMGVKHPNAEVIGVKRRADGVEFRLRRHTHKVGCKVGPYPRAAATPEIHATEALSGLPLGLFLVCAASRKSKLGDKWVSMPDIAMLKDGKFWAPYAFLKNL